MKPNVSAAGVRRNVVLIAVGLSMIGCANDVVVKNPQTGATETCQESLHGLNPWSQTMGCVSEHVAQGWTVSGQE